MDDSSNVLREKAKKIEIAVSYRLCVYVINNYKIGDYGTERGTQGYKISEEEFEKKHKNIKFEDFHDELLLEALVDIKNRFKEKNTYSDMISQKTDKVLETHEFLRKSYNSIYKAKEKKIQYITEDKNLRKIKENSSLVEDCNFIEAKWDEILKTAKEEVKNMETKSIKAKGTESKSLEMVDLGLDDHDIEDLEDLEVERLELKELGPEGIKDFLLKLIELGLIELEVIDLDTTEEKIVEGETTEEEIVEGETTEAEKIIKSLQNILRMKKELGFEELEDDDFLEITLEGSIGYIYENEIEKGRYNSLQKSTIKEILSKKREDRKKRGELEAGNKENEETNKRIKPKETIYEKLYKGTLPKINQIKFEEGYIDMLYLREGMINRDEKIDRYALEQELNLGLYSNISEEIISLGVKKQETKPFIEEITELLVYANSLIDNGHLSRVLNSKVSKDDKAYLAYIEELKQTFKLKKRIINDMPKYDYEEELEEMVSEGVKKRLEDVEERSECLKDELGSIESIRKLEVVKLLLERNNEILRLREDAKKRAIGIR